MDSNRRAAVSAGVLFMAATVLNIAGTSLSRSLLDSADFLTRVGTDANRVTAGAVLELVSALACPGIALAMYPVLKRYSSGLALGSVALRTIEAVMYGIAAVGLLSVLAISRRPPPAVADAAAARALLDVRDQASLVAVLAFTFGALMYYTVLYRARLVPRWLSGWGILALVVMLGVWAAAMFSHRSMTAYAPLVLPLAVQEMVLAVWLIVKGFAIPDGPGTVPTPSELLARTAS